MSGRGLKMAGQGRFRADVDVRVRSLTDRRVLLTTYMNRSAQERAIKLVR